MKFNNNLKSIGYMYGTEMLELMGFDLDKPEQIQEYFNNKSITDRGAGLSDLLVSIAKYSTPSEFRPIDPVYQEDSFDRQIQDTTRSLLQELEENEDIKFMLGNQELTKQQSRKLDRNIRMYNTALDQIKGFNCG